MIIYLPKTYTISTITQNPSYLIIGYMDPLGSMVEKVFGRSRLQQRHREEALFPHCCDAAGLGWKDWMFKVWGSGFVGLGRLRRLCLSSAFFHLHDTKKTARSGDEKV